MIKEQLNTHHALLMSTCPMWGVIQSFLLFDMLGAKGESRYHDAILALERLTRRSMA